MPEQPPEKPETKPADNTQLLGELEALRRENADYKAKVTEYEAKVSELSSGAEIVERYKGDALSRFKAIHEALPEHIKKHISAEDYESDPLTGIKHINDFTAFADAHYEERKKAEAGDPDPTQKPPAHGGGDTTPISSKSWWGATLARRKANK